MVSSYERMQVSVIAFFTAGSMVQVVLSILISVFALAYHVYALPYRESWLNMMQGACLLCIYLTLQAGLMVQNTLPDRNVGDAFLVALSVANIVMLVSPVLLGLIAALQILPESIRRRASFFFTGPALAPGEDKPGANRDLSDDAPQDVTGWETVDLSPPALGLPSVEHVAAGAAPAAVNVDTTHIELTALTADALQLADVEAWQGNALFGPGLSAVPAAEVTFFPPTAAEESPGRASDAQFASPSATEHE